MHHLARGSVLLLMAVCAPAWGEGFCDIPPGNGNGCPQVRSVERDPVSGDLLPDFSDLDLPGHPFVGYPIGFDLDFSDLSVAESTPVTVLELGFSGSLTDSRVLTMSVAQKRGAYMLVFDWLSAQPTWSSADTAQSWVTVIDTIAVAIPAPQMSVSAVIAPSASNGEDIFVGGQYVGNFGFPDETTRHQVLRLRTGVISGYSREHSTTRYAFLSPPLNE